MHPITTVHYLVLSAALLLIGTVGVLTRRNIVIILMSIELILNAVNINLIAFSHALKDIGGQIFAIFVITDAVAEAAVGLGILIALFRNKETVLAVAKYYVQRFQVQKKSGIPCSIAVEDEGERVKIDGFDTLGAAPR